MPRTQHGRRWRVAAGMLILAFTLLIPLQSAVAGGPTGAGRITKIVEQMAAADDPYAAFAALPERDQLAVKDYLTVATKRGAASTKPATEHGPRVSSSSALRQTSAVSSTAILG